MRIVKTYADHGKSGLRVDGRDALRRLIDNVQSGAASFRAILVYDVSRWGRFQDADESAYYEFICKEAGSLRLRRRESARPDLSHAECKARVRTPFTKA